MMKKLLIFAVAAVASVACGDKNETPPGPYSHSGHVSSIVVRSTVYGEVHRSAVTFIYDDQHRLTQIDDDDNVEYQYSEGAAQVSIGEGYVCDYTLDGDGHATTGLANVGVFTMTYDDGYIASLTIDGGADGITTAEYTWSEGNLTGVAAQNDGVHSSATMEYGTVPNNPECNIDLNTLAYQNVIFHDSPAAMIGLLGRRSDNMLSRLVLYDFACNFAYETDPLGFVTKITMTIDGVSNQKVEYLISYN
jgi:hypothetical protein